MYLEMVRETEKAINILIAVQQKCEDLYVEATEPEIVLLGGNHDAETGPNGNNASE